METASVPGLAAAAVAAALGGSALAPMKYQRGWGFEQTWLIYAAAAYLTFPWLAALTTVPNLPGVYASAGFNPVALTALFGFGWGMAVVLNGYAVTLVGLAVTTGVLMGSSIAVGSLAAVALVRPEVLRTGEGLQLVLINLGLMAGVALCSWAGSLREHALGADAAEHPPGTARKGILLCLLAGILSTLFNLALANGQSISEEAVRHGASNVAAANAVWAIAISAGSLPSLIWCVWRLQATAGWAELGRTKPAANTARCLLMAALWISGTVLYGAATRMMGDLGPALGWPVYMSGMIVAATAWGWVTGEWRGARQAPVRLMLAGVAVQIVFMALMGQVSA